MLKLRPNRNLSGDAFHPFVTQEMGSVSQEIKRRTGNKNNSKQRPRRGLIHFNTQINPALYSIAILFLIVILLKVSRQHFTKSLKSSYTFKVFKGTVLIFRDFVSFTSAAHEFNLILPHVNNTC